MINNASIPISTYNPNDGIDTILTSSNSPWSPSPAYEAEVLSPNRDRVGERPLWFGLGIEA